MLEEEIILPGHRACPGCGGAIAERLILNTLGRNTILFGEGVCASACTRNVTIPSMTLHFSGVVAGATGIISALEAKGKTDITVASFNGDGATSDIGFAKLSAGAERNDNLIHFCLDNEAYMNTGIQKSHLTPYKAWTTTTPWGKTTPKKNLPLLMAYHFIPYVATVSVAYPKDFISKVEKAKKIKGFKYIHVLCPCPTGWRFSAEKTIEVARLAVQTRVWPLYEVENGKLTITVKPKKRSVKDYLAIQGRFRHLTEEDIQQIERHVDKEWERLERLEQTGI